MRDDPTSEATQRATAFSENLVMSELFPCAVPKTQNTKLVGTAAKFLAGAQRQADFLDGEQSPQASSGGLPDVAKDD